MKAFGIGNVAGLVAAAYFAPPGCLYPPMFWQEDRAALGLTVLLLAFNPQILQGLKSRFRSRRRFSALLALADLGSLAETSASCRIPCCWRASHSGPACWPADRWHWP